MSTRGKKIKFLKQIPDGILLNLSRQQGFPIWRKRMNGDYFAVLLHRLVAKYFLPKPLSKEKFIIHLDYNKENNYYKNLKWVTRMQMTDHNQTNPRVMAAHAARKGRINNSKLTEADVLRLKKKIKRGKVRLYQLAKEFGITHTQLNRIRKGQNWAHVKLEDED